MTFAVTMSTFADKNSKHQHENFIPYNYFSAFRICLVLLRYAGDQLRLLWDSNLYVGLADRGNIFIQWFRQDA